MKKLTLAICAIAVAAFAALAGGSGAAETPATLHLVGTQIAEHGPKGRVGPGSMIVFTSKETGEDNGISYAQCTVIDSRHGLCLGRFNLKRGTLAVETALRLEPSQKVVTLEITGGTGDYDGARGTATFTDIGKDKTDEVFTFKP